MNYIQIFAKGGRTKTTAQDEANVMLQVLDSIGIDQETATNKLSELAEANDADTMNQIKQAINTIVKGQNDPTAQGAIKEATDFLYNTFSQSQLFKCGGKLAQKAKKKMSGGKVDCGCKGTKIGKHQEGGLVLPKNDPIRNFMIQKDSTWVNNGIPGREIVIASPDQNGNAFSLIVQGPDSTATAGMIENGKFTPNGEIPVNPKYLDAAIKSIHTKAPNQKGTSKSMQSGGELKQGYQQVYNSLSARGYDNKRIEDTINRTMANMTNSGRYNNLSGEELELEAYKNLLGNRQTEPIKTPILIDSNAVILRQPSISKPETINLKAREVKAPENPVQSIAETETKKKVSKKANIDKTTTTKKVENEGLRSELELKNQEPTKAENGFWGSLVATIANIKNAAREEVEQKPEKQEIIYEDPYVENYAGNWAYRPDSTALNKWKGLIRHTEKNWGTPTYYVPIEYHMNPYFLRKIGVTKIENGKIYRTQ